MKALVSRFVFFTAITVVSCGSTNVSESEIRQLEQAARVPPAEVVQAPAETSSAAVEAPVVIQAPVQEPIQEEIFDSEAVSAELYKSTLHELQDFIENLNRIIRSRNYEGWKAALSNSFFARIASPRYLQDLSNTDALKVRKIVLRTPQDYFTHVVVPSRANSRVDDIEFISENRVKAFTVNTTRSGQVVRLRLYDLEHSGNIWKIID